MDHNTISKAEFDELERKLQRKPTAAEVAIWCLGKQAGMTEVVIHGFPVRRYMYRNRAAKIR